MSGTDQPHGNEALSQLIASAIRSPHLDRAKGLAEQAAAIKTGPKGDLAAAGLLALVEQRFDEARGLAQELLRIADDEQSQLAAEGILALAERQPDRAAELAEQLEALIAEDDQ